MPSRGSWTLADIPRLDGKRAIVTGATGGIGFVAALQLARAGAEVTLTGRDPARGEAALARIRQTVPQARVRYALADLGSLDAVRDFAATVAEPLGLLVNNAGVMGFPKRRLTRDGFEAQFGVNHLGHFALTGLLVPALLRAKAPRVVIVASIAHRHARIDFGDLQGERSYSARRAYRQSKLANLIFALELARRARAAHSPLASIAVHPGLSMTGIFEGLGPGTLVARAARLAIGALGQSAAHGAWPTLYGATSPDASSGSYYGPRGFLEFAGPPSVARIEPQARDPETARRLWEVSERLTGIAFPPLG